MNGGVPWILVAIHELAHAFGLSDEYIDDKIRDDRLPPRYDNVSNAVRAADLPWNDLANLPAETALEQRNDGTPIDEAPDSARSPRFAVPITATIIGARPATAGCAITGPTGSVRV